jgi:hypothetical protein
MKKMLLALFCSLLAAGTVLAADLNAESFLAMSANDQAAAINSASPANLVALFQGLADKATPMQKSNATDALLALLNKNKETAAADTEALVKQLNDAVDFLNIVKNSDGIYINQAPGQVKAGEPGEKGIQDGAAEEIAEGVADFDLTIVDLDETITNVDLNIYGHDTPIKGGEEPEPEPGPGPTPPGPTPPISRRASVY